MQEKALWQRMHQEIFFLPTKIKLQIWEPANDDLRNFSLKNSSWSDRPSYVNIELLQTVAEESSKCTRISRSVQHKLHFDHKHLHQLGKVTTLGQCVPRHLTASRLNKSVALYSSLKSRHASVTFLCGIMTRDEKWLLSSYPTKTTMIGSSRKSTINPQTWITDKKILCPVFSRI